MSFYGGNQNGGQPGSAQQQQMGRQPGGQPGLQNVQQVLTPQLFNINQHQLHTFFNDHNSSQNQLQMNAAANAPSILLQPLQTQFPVNLINDQLGVGVGQLMPPTTVSQSQMQGLPISMSSALNFAQTIPVQSSPQQAQSNQQSKQRVFTGTVTKTHDNFGFIDEEVFFQMGVVKGPILPKEGDRVLVEADFNQGGMPFKWNATRVQIVNIGGGLNSSMNNSVGVAPPVSQMSQNPSYSSQQQHLGFNPGIMKQSGAPPPPILSSQSGSVRPHCAQPVTIVSNPHSVYSGVTNSRGRGTTIGGAPPPGQPIMVNQSRDSKRPIPQMGMSMPPDPPQFNNNSGLPGLMSSDRDLDMDRSRDSRDHPRDRSRERSRERLRKRSRERVRPRSRERSRERVRDRSKERNRSRSRDRVPRDISRDRNPRAISRDRSRSRDRGLRDRSPDRSLPVRRVRSRSRDASRDRKGRGRSTERQERSKRDKTPEKQRPRSKERTREKEIGKERENRKKSTSPSSKSSREESKKDSKDNNKSKDKPPTEKPRTVRERSPAGNASDRSKRSRSKDSVRTDKGHGGVARSRSRSCSPKRKNTTRTAPRYAVEVPKFSLDLKELSVKEMQRRYPNLYVPSDFFLSRSTWMDTFPLYKSFELGHACPVQIMRKGVQKIEIPDPEGLSDRFNNIPDILEPSDASFTFKAKVMIPSMNSLDTIYRKACGVNTTTSDAPVSDSPQHVDRLISFIVGMKTSKHEVMALGGPWSPSLDGANPQSDPQTLINTAIRCVRALTGINLSRCKRWFRFMELYYKRPNCLETVVIYLPDVWSCLPGSKEWTKIKSVYKYALHGEISELKQKSAPEKDSATPDASVSPLGAVDIIVDSVKASHGETPASDLSVDKEGNNDESVNGCPESIIEDVLNTSGLLVIDEAASPVREDGCTEDIKTNDLNDVGHSTSVGVAGAVAEQMEDSKTTEENKLVAAAADQKETASNSEVSNLQTEQVLNAAIDDVAAVVKDLVASPSVNSAANVPISPVKMPTHFSHLSPKNMNVNQLREELSRRQLSSKGLKQQLTTRLVKALKEEETLEEVEKQNVEAVEDSGTTVNNSNEDNSIVSDNTMDVDKKQCDGETKEPQSESSNTKNEQNSEDEHCIRLVNPSLIMEDDEMSVEDGELKEDIENGEINCQVLSEFEQMFSKYTQEMFPIIKPGMKDEDVKMWERRYALPKNPRVLAFPSTTAKSGNFDCLSMTLGLLRDYRIIDKKEDSFEVSLFSEFFHEMLQRDFAFRIYREIVSESSKASTTDDASAVKENEKEEKAGKDASEPNTKKRKLSTSSVTVSQTAPVVKTTDPYLLLSFIFFDVTRCGYVTETDLEDLCNSIGIGLTRAQIRKYVQKVVHKGTLYYRKWTDRPEKSKSNSITDKDEIRTLALGNKAFFPIFVLPNDENFKNSKSADCDESTNAVLAIVDGRSVDVKKLLNKLEKCEKTLSIAESGLNVMKNSLNESKSQVSDMKKSNESLKEELAKIKEALKKSESSEKVTKDDVEVFKRSTERFLERVKDLVKFPSCSTKEKEKSENAKESGKEKDIKKEKSTVEQKPSPSE